MLTYTIRYQTSNCHKFHTSKLRKVKSETYTMFTVLFCILRFINKTLGSLNQKNIPANFLTMSMLFVLNSFMKKRLIAKSSDAVRDLESALASKPYDNIGIHLLLMSSSTTSSDETLPIVLFAAL